jgi:hypothetical protein
MTELPQPHEKTCNSRDPSLPAQDRLESLICALIELKSNISAVEQQHPALSNDLSSICDLVLDHLNRPLDTVTIAVSQPLSILQDQPDNKVSFKIDQNNSPAALSDYTAFKKTPVENTNLLALICNKLGDYMENGLDKMGDGVIFAIDKLLSLGHQKKSGANEDPA